MSDRDVPVHFAPADADSEKRFQERKWIMWRKILMVPLCLFCAVLLPGHSGPPSQSPKIPSLTEPDTLRPQSIDDLINAPLKTGPLGEYGDAAYSLIRNYFK